MRRNSSSDQIWNCVSFYAIFLQGPKAEDRQQVLSKEVRLPNAPPTILDNQDAEIVNNIQLQLFPAGNTFRIMNVTERMSTGAR